MFKEYLQLNSIVDFNNTKVSKKAKELALNSKDDEEIAKNCFLFVRDKIAHSGDIKSDIPTLKASEVLEHKVGWCYSKSILLTALLRANSIPAGFAYQRLSCSEYEDGIYCLHGLNWIYIKKYGWYRVDARGNKDGVDAEFTPPIEKLAFNLGKNEYDIDGNFINPLSEVIDALSKNKTYSKMVNNFPDIKSGYET